jgi:cytidylate kinase
MAIITISRGSYSHGKEIAEKIANKLGYCCISRDLLLETSEQFNIPEIRLTKAIEEVPSILERFTGEREKYLAFIEAALLEHAQKDNMVYHGLAAHFILKPIRHALHVRITANMEDRAELVMEREEVSHEEALRLLTKIDHARKQWGLVLYGIDLWDSSNYDLVINGDKITVDNAVDTICRTAGWDQFKTTPESQTALDELALAATMKAKLTMPKSDILENKLILAVDDEKGVLELIEEELSEIPGLRLQRATSFERAAEYLVSYTYDLVLLDITGVRGFDLLNVAVSKDLPAVMLTAHALNPQALKESIELGAKAFLPKDRLGELVPFLEEVLKLGYQSGWKKVVDHISAVFDIRFGSDWRKSEKEFWKDFEKKLTMEGAAIIQ